MSLINKVKIYLCSLKVHKLKRYDVKSLVITAWRIIWWPTTKSFNEMVLNINRSCWSTGTNAKRVSVVKIRVVSTNVKNMFQTCDEKFSVYSTSIFINEQRIWKAKRCFSTPCDCQVLFDGRERTNSMIRDVQLDSDPFTKGSDLEAFKCKLAYE